jgi:hypothetical protein
MPTERPPLVGEVGPTFADRGCCVSVFLAGYLNIKETEIDKRLTKTWSAI